MTYDIDAPGTSTDPAATMFPPGRYGRRRAPRRTRRWVLPTALTVTIALLALLAVKLYGQYGTDRFSPTVLRLSDISDSSITVEAQVVKPGGEAAVCTVTALAKDGAVVGRAEVPVPAGTKATFTYTVHTSARPYVADVPSCRPA
jgi:hypothetical protein